MKDVFLVLANGRVFPGKAFGADIEAVGEMVFTTGMTGYNETLTDPSYFGQIVCQTFPLIGNCGMIPDDFESPGCVMKGYVVREFCAEPSNFRNTGRLDEWLKSNGIPAICGVDTRALTAVIRESGVMNAAITYDPDSVDKKALAAYTIKNSVESVSGKDAGFYASTCDSGLKLALLDYGVKRSIIRRAVAEGCSVTVLPYDTAAAQLLDGGFDGVILSNGPGDPTDNPACVEELKKLLGKLPVMGVCLGHQLLALAVGGRTQKLKYGHRGANQPVTDTVSGHTYITTQNHGYAVVSDSVKCGRLRFVNANDGSCEGFDYPEYNAFSVQFHPEASAGPKDTFYLFKRFCDMIRGEKNA